MNLDKGDQTSVPLEMQSAFTHIPHQRFSRKLNREIFLRIRLIKKIRKQKTGVNEQPCLQWKTLHCRSSIDMYAGFFGAQHNHMHSGKGR